jgi:two-component system, NarL family, uhpT operon response regulator UhpA
MIKIFVADDHSIVRQGLKQLFAISNVSLAGEATNGAQLMEALRKVAADLLLLDMTMPGIHGVELIERVRAEHPALPILVLSMHNEPQIARRALIAGATGYCTKDSDPEVLMEAIRKVAAGGRFIDAGLAEMMAFDTGKHEKYLPHEILSDREYDILRMLVKGKSVNDIAAELVISNKTVSTHKARLMQKLNLQNNAELVRFGVEHGLA